MDAGDLWLLLVGLVVDAARRVRTAWPVRLASVGPWVPERCDYEPSPWGTLARGVRRREILAHDEFLDIGCGKGRVLVEACGMGFARVWGIDVEPAFIARASRNVDRALPAGRAHLTCGDAAVEPVPDSVTWVYLYNPVLGATFDAVLQRLVESQIRRPRPLNLLYFHGEERDRLEALPGCRLVRDCGRGLRRYRLDPVRTASSP